MADFTSTAGVTPDAATSTVGITPDASTSTVGVTPGASNFTVGVTPDASSDAFGDQALPPALEALRNGARRLPANRLGRWGASLTRRALYLAGDGPFDIEVFGGVRARVWPRTNRCEKRIFSGDQFFDRAERATLERVVRAGKDPFVFVDAGANVGLYTLAVLAACARAGRAARAIAVEPDGENGARLRTNLAANRFAATVVPAALAGESGMLRLTPATHNRGEITATSDADGEVVEALSLTDLYQRCGIDRVDAMKMDIEGGERAALMPFLAEAPHAHWPRLLIVETGKVDQQGLIPLLTEAGYTLIQRTRLNAILSRAENDAEDSN